jgi:hypothetical protein
MLLEGSVVLKRINPGSKSDHEAAVLIAGDHQYKLRRQGGNPFADPEVLALAGKRIRAEGFVSAGQFIMERYEIIDEKS